MQNASGGCQERNSRRQHGKLHIQSQGSIRDDESITVSQKLSNDTIIKTTNRNSNIQQNQNTEDMLCIYTNFDCLPNKIQELKCFINLSEKVPDIIALTEIKYKNKWHVNTAELNIDGYHLFSNNLWEQNLGIIIYAKQDLNCKQVFLNNSCMEYVPLEIQTDLNKVMQVAIIYRSPNSFLENGLNMCSLIDHICSRSGYKLFLGDFNFPNINWNTWNAVSHLERKFIDTLQKQLYTTVYLLSNPCKRFRNPTFTRLNHNR